MRRRKHHVARAIRERVDQALAEQSAEGEHTWYHACSGYDTAAVVELINVALESGLTRGQVIDLHADYLRAMAEVALDDGVVIEDERADLERVAAMLGLANGDVNMALELAADQEHGRHRAGSAVASAGLKLSPGDRVCFTGEMGRPRSAWEQAVERKGLSCGGLTKSTAILVAADPNSLSGKAEKARRFGIPVVTEDAFEKLLSQVAP